MKTPEFTLEHPCGLRISRQLKKSDLLMNDVFEERDMQNGYVWCDLEPALIFGQEVAISICFFHEDLDSVRLNMGGEKYGSSWADWSESKERQRAKDTEDWLRSIGYVVGSFDWGDVWAGYDAKGASGHGGIRYKK